jgi:NAD(P)-dependent dehydrogenase (short-subunit alcohol dehydrogenase family)
MTGIPVLTWDKEGADIDVDVSDTEQVAKAAARTLDAIGTPATVTVTAGIGHQGTLARVGRNDFDKVFAVNTVGVWDVLHSFVDPMLDAGFGSMVAVSSVSGRLVDRGMGVYCASKAALNMLIQVAAVEWGPTIRVNAVAPGVTDTPMLGPAPRDGDWLGGVARRTALGRLGKPSDIAEAIVAVHEMSWATGQIIEVDGGLGLASPISPTR